MTSTLTTSFLLVSTLLGATAAQAQVTFGIGPRIGLNLSKGKFSEAYAPSLPNHDVPTRYRSGVEAGLVASVGFGHFALQPALLYSQKGFAIQDTHQDVMTSSNYGTTIYELSHDDTYRLNYLTLPLNFTYAQHAGGQGFQLFAGPYLSWLLSGQWQIHTKREERIGPSFYSIEETSYKGEFVPYDEEYVHANGLLPRPGKQYSRRLDAGVQFGLGYRLGGALLQVGYSLGLQNQAVGREVSYYGSSGSATKVVGPKYYNRAFHVSLSYLFGRRVSNLSKH
jgi:hypothetical protein